MVNAGKIRSDVVANLIPIQHPDSVGGIQPYDQTPQRRDALVVPRPLSAGQDVSAERVQRIALDFNKPVRAEQNHSVFDFSYAGYLISRRPVIPVCPSWETLV